MIEDSPKILASEEKVTNNNNNNTQCLDQNESVVNRTAV